MIALAEKICTTCNGSGEFRYKREGLDPAFNVAGFIYSRSRDEFYGQCRDCKSRGFIRLRSLPPLIKRKS